MVGRTAKRVEMAAVYGPSFGLQKRAFVDRYGSERALLEWVNIELDALEQLERIQRG